MHFGKDAREGDQAVACRGIDGARTGLHADGAGEVLHHDGGDHHRDRARFAQVVVVDEGYRQAAGCMQQGLNVGAHAEDEHDEENPSKYSRQYNSSNDSDRCAHVGLECLLRDVRDPVVVRHGPCHSQQSKGKAKPVVGPS